MSRKNPSTVKKTYESYYSNSISFRKQWFGEITYKYIIPKYFFCISKFITDKKKITILELGAGDGEITDYIRKKKSNWMIVPTEFTTSGVEKLRKKGYLYSKVVDAQKVPYKKNSFDYVVCFDVMHHVKNPIKMAYEMNRVSKKGIFLIEANKSSLIRRALETTEIYKKAGEKSYYPDEYRSFFNFQKVRHIKISPFQFIPPKVLNFNTSLTILISELISKIPLLKWQCSGLAIEIDKK